jgi:serine/threonine-protein kinase RsbW
MLPHLGHHALRFPGSRAGLEQAAADLRVFLDRANVHGRARYYAELAFEEVVSNVVRYAYSDGAAHQIDVSVELSTDAIVLTFLDDGRPFDPSQQPAPVLPSTIEAAPSGGLGLLLMRQRAADMRYERTPDGKNRLTVKIAARP